jgi:signal transduction histidine kinase
MLLLLIGFLLYRYKSSKQRIKLLQIEKQMEISHLNAMIEGEEKERRRLATELHDGIGGLLGSIRLQLSSAIRNYKTQDRSADFKFILKLLENTYADLRKTAHNLMPETLQQEGLETATRLFCLGISTNGKPDIIFESVGELPPIPPSIELSLYRMIQELVHNIIKHANASKALVQLVYIDNKLGLTVEDDGQGFDVQQKVQEQQGMGLSAIRKRVKSLGGNMDISGSPGEGTSIYIEIIISRNENITIAR